ncbi:MAG: monovalent cation/H(+) antiporter subunit G [Rhodobacteraceae bacterium]|nr:monovalent cation/H(+) antiporter subunit G [Paracoccaceae bacterium]
MIQIIAGICVLGGGIFVFIAGLGILKLPDVLNRMHASTKAGTLGSALTLVAAALHFGNGGVTTKAVATILFLLLTAPIAAHMIGRATVQIRRKKAARAAAQAGR